MDSVRSNDVGRVWIPSVLRAVAPSMLAVCSTLAVAVLPTVNCYAADNDPPKVVNPNAAMAPPASNCHIGAYRLSDGGIVDIEAEENGLRWLRFDGTTGALHRVSDKASGSTAAETWTSTSGWSDRSDGKSASFGDCGQGSIVFAGVQGKRIDLNVVETTFQSHGIALAGRLVMPPGNGKAPVIVLVHGSEASSALDSYQFQRLLPAHAVGAFVYDKRGTGHSQGKYTQDFSLLADDVVAAMHEARRLAGARLTRIGYHGGSQGGWVGPIAANRAPVDFVIAAFGLAVSVIDEDQEEVAIEMREEGHSPAEIADALKVASAAELVVASNFTKGFAEFDALRAKYHDAPWYKDLHGNYTYLLLPYTEAQLKELGRTDLSFVKETPFYYDPMPTLRAAAAPELWVLGGEDYQAPSAETRRRLDGLIGAGHPFTVAYYPKAEHGMTLFEVNAKGERVSTQYAPGYFKMICDFARDGRLTGAYGDAVLTKRHAQ